MELAVAERRIVRALAGALPGAAAHARLAPRPRTGWRPGEVPGEAREAAGLLLLYPDREGAARFVLTLRPRGLARHGGQVSLPGGVVEPGESVEDAALREAREEVGAGTEGIRILGRLSPLHVPASGFVIRTVVAVAGRALALFPSDGEVEAILEVPLDDLLEPSRLREEIRRLDGRDCRVPYFALEGHVVWGATAMILAELVALLSASGPPILRADRDEGGDHPPEPVVPGGGVGPER